MGFQAIASFVIEFFKDALKVDRSPDVLSIHAAPGES